MNKNINFNIVKKTKNGFQKPLHPYQIISYIVFIVNLFLFYTFIIPGVG